MTVSTLRPSSTVSNNGALTQGSAPGNTAHQILADNNDDSFVTFDEGERLEVGLDDLTLPAGAIIKSVAVRLRLQRSGLTGSAYADVIFQQEDTQGIRNLEGSALASWTAFQTITLVSGNRFGWGLKLTPGGFDLTADLAFSDTRIDNATLHITNRTVAGALGGDLVVAAAYVDVTYVTVPTIGVGRPSDPTTDNTSPPVIWLQALDSAQPVSSHFHAKIFTDAQVADPDFDPDTTPTFFNSGVQAAAFTTVGVWDYSLTLPDGEYVAYAKTAVTVNGTRLWSAWDDLAFTMDVDDPAEPLLFVTPDADNARIKLQIAPVSGTVSTDFFEIERSDDAEQTWNPVRTDREDGLLASPGQAVIIYDYEAPNGVEVTYRVRSLHDYEPGYSASDWVDGIGLWESDRWWFKHPILPEMNLEIGGALSAMRSHPGTSRESRQGIFQPIGARAKEGLVVVSDKRGPKTGRMGIKLISQTLKEQVDELIEEESPLFIQAPAEHHEPDRWVVIGADEKERFIDVGWFEPSMEHFDWIEIPRPTIPGGTIVAVEEPPEEVESIIALDSFNAGAAGTGTLSWTHTPVNNGEIIGVIVGVVNDSDGLGEPLTDVVSVEGIEMPMIAEGSVPGNDEGNASLYMLGNGIPSGPLDIQVTVTGATAKRACSWLVYGEGGDANVDDVLVDQLANSLTFESNLTTTAERDVIIGCAYTSPNAVTSIDVGLDMVNDHEEDFGVNTAIFFHRVDDMDFVGATAVRLNSTEATCDYGVVAVALRVGVAPEAPGAAVLREDLATQDNICGVPGDPLWVRIDSAFTPGSSFNYTGNDLQHVRRTASPDPHIPVAAGGASTHYRRAILSSAELAAPIVGSPSSIQITADAALPVPTTGVISVNRARAATYTGRSGSFPNYTLTGLTWIEGTGDFAAGALVCFQSLYDSGVPNDSYRAHVSRWSASPSSTFFTYQPNRRYQTVLSIRFDTDHLPWDPVPSRNVGARSQVWQYKTSPTSPFGPTFSMVQFGDIDELQIRYDFTGNAAVLDTFSFDPSAGWLRFMMDITFAPSATDGRFQLFGDLDGDKLNYDEMVPITEQFALKTCGNGTTDPMGEISNFGWGPYCPMVVPGHWRDYANIQVIDPDAL